LEYWVFKRQSNRVQHYVIQVIECAAYFKQVMCPDKALENGNNNNT